MEKIYFNKPSIVSGLSRLQFEAIGFELDKAVSGKHYSLFTYKEPNLSITVIWFEEFGNLVKIKVTNNSDEGNTELLFEMTAHFCSFSHLREVLESNCFQFHNP